MSQLPFLYDADLTELDGTVVDHLSCSVWPAQSQRDGQAGEVFDHVGEVPLAAAETLSDSRNKTLVVKTGPLAGSYRIVGATPQPFTRHVGLELTRVKP